MSQPLISMELEQLFSDDKVRALAQAAGNGKVKRLKQLVGEGIDVNSSGLGKATPLFWALRNHKGFAALLELGADANVVFDDGGTVLHWAARQKDCRLLKTALKHDVDVNLVAGMLSQSPLFETINLDVKAGIPKCFSLLLAHNGIDLNLKRKFGNTPILAAAGFGRFDLVYQLLERGADYRLKNDHGTSLQQELVNMRKALKPGSGSAKWLEKVADWLRQQG